MINLLIAGKYIESNAWSYQFQYFSFNTMFFALFPMDFPNGTPSDGRAVWLLWKNRIKNKQSDDLVFNDIEEKIEEMYDVEDHKK
ncbi:hypothetical protein JOC77_003924 [Peribacillus deserti]|uniref:Uncharacterized protein n=1 Tax=Peribacillus deserti TaxID=673318 RepID=A0ABS2QPR7_9BACI|nr:hypothetical protein [Peribacillus deserti]MBM7694463.1 hypothetical protein [Peribacillus deserti]